MFTGYNYEQNTKANYYKYVCGGYKNKGKTVCNNNNKIDKEKDKTKSEINRLIEAIKSGVDADLLKEEINNLKSELVNIESRKKELSKVYNDKNIVSKGELKLFLSNFDIIL